MRKTVRQPNVPTPTFTGAFEFPTVGARYHEEVHEYKSGGAAEYTIDVGLNAYGDLSLKVTRHYFGDSPVHPHVCGEIRLEHPDEVAGFVPLLRQATEALPALLDARAAMKQKPSATLKTA